MIFLGDWGVDDFGDFGTRQQSLIAWSLQMIGRGLAQTDGNEAENRRRSRLNCSTQLPRTRPSAAKAQKQKTPAKAGVFDRKPVYILSFLSSAFSFLAFLCFLALASFLSIFLSSAGLHSANAIDELVTSARANNIAISFFMG